MSINTENAPSRSIFCGKLGEKIHFRRSRNSSSMSELATPSVTQNPRSTNTTGAESRRTDATHGGPQKRDGSNGGDTTIVPQSANSGSRVADEEKATAETLYKELGILYQKSYDNGILHPHCTPEDSYRARVASEQSRQQSIQELQSEYRSLFVQVQADLPEEDPVYTENRKDWVHRVEEFQVKTGSLIDKERVRQLREFSREEKVGR